MVFAVAGVIVFVFVAGLPGKIAIARNQQRGAGEREHGLIRQRCLLGRAPGGLLEVLDFLRNHRRVEVFLHGICGGGNGHSDNHTGEHDARPGDGDGD